MKSARSLIAHCAEWQGVRVIDAKSAVKQTVYATLSPAFTADEAGVFEDVPEDEKFPVIILGDIESVPFGRHDDPDRRVTITLVTLTEGDESAPCIALQAKAEGLLGDKSFQKEGWVLHVSLGSSDAALTEDGLGYVGTSIINVLAFRED